MILGTTLVALGIPGTIAAWSTLASEPALDKLRVGQAPTKSELEAAKGGLTVALGWRQSGRRWADLAAVELAQAIQMDAADPDRATLLTDAEQHLETGLVLDPTDAFAWYRLAQVRMFSAASGERVAAALVQSLHAASNMRALWIPRAALLLRYRKFLSEDEFLALRSQLRSIWSDSPAYRSSLIKMSLESGTLPFVAAAVGDDPSSVEEFERFRAQIGQTAHR